MKRDALIDSTDILTLVGTGLIAAGLWFVWAPAILFWVGFVCLALVAVSKWSAKRQK